MSDQLQSEKKYNPSYGDLTELNTCRMILDTVGESTLKEIAKNYLELMETSGAIYEVNGDYALGIFSSGWCQCLNSASRELCNTDDNIAALNSGKWICHDCCWNEASLESIKTKEPVDIECKGGIHLYAVPILADGKAFGSMNMGYGDPPSDPEKLLEISKRFQVDFDELSRLANEYVSRPPQIISAAKSQLITSAKLIGQIIERQQVGEALRKTTYDLGERVKELDCLYGISKLIEKENITTEEMLQGIVDLIPASWQYPEITCALIKLDDQTYKTDNFTKTEWIQSQEIIVSGKKYGVVEIYYLEEKPEIAEGPFLNQERDLINAIVEKLEHIIEQKRAREALRKAHDELEVRVEERTKELATQNVNLHAEIRERRKAEEELRKSEEKIKLFAYSVAHDLKNPAITSYGLARRLVKKYGEILTENGRSSCGQILRSSEQIVSLTDKIYTYITTKENLLIIEQISLKEVFKTIQEEFSTQLKIRSITWKEAENLPKTIEADRVAILRILRNLVDNALKYGGDNLNIIEAGYKETDDFHIISIADDGIGLDKEDFKKIFGIFKRKESSRDVMGAGLGLAIVKEIAELHKGTVWVECRSKRGIIFYVSISKFLQNNYDDGKR